MSGIGISTAVDLPFQEAIDFFTQKANVTTKQWTDVWNEAHARSFSVAGAASDALVQDFRQAVERALKEGISLGEFRKSFDEIVARRGWEHTGTAGWRARLIYETNLSTAYGAGRYKQMSQPDVLAVYPYWMYRHSGNPHPRLQHKAWDGMTLRADDTWWVTNYPPNGFHCGCYVEPLSARELARQGKHGPDGTPPLDLHPAPVGKTGRTEMVPRGVDPGFAHNPGMIFDGGVKMPRTAITAVPVAPPAPPLTQPAAPHVAPKVAPAAPAAPSMHPAKEPTPAAPKPPEPVALPEPPKTIVERKAVDRDLRTVYDAWADTLPEEQRGALRAYKGNLFAAMNDHLRGVSDMAEFSHLSERLDRALARAPALPPMVLFRGLGTGSPALRAKVGQTVPEAGFMSASIWRETALDFAPSGKILVVRVRKAYHGAAYVHPYPTEHLSEHEILFRPGSKFKVVEITDDEIIAEAIDEPRRRPRLTPRKARRAQRRE